MPKGLTLIWSCCIVFGRNDILSRPNLSKVKLRNQSDNPLDIWEKIERKIMGKIIHFW